MFVPKFNNLIDDWAEHLNVGMLISDEGSAMDFVEEGIRRAEEEDTWAWSSIDLVPWVPTQSGHADMIPQRLFCMGQGVAADERHMQNLMFPSSVEFLDDPLPTANELINEMELERVEQTCVTKIIKGITDPRVSLKRTYPWKNSLYTPEVQGTLKDVIKGVSLKNEFEEVVAKVEKAVGDLPSSSANKKLRRSITMVAGDVRESTKEMAEKEAIEGIAVNDGKAVVIVNSDSSEDMATMGKKRKYEAQEKFETVTTVSLRVRGKLRPKSTVELIRQVQHMRKARFPVRRVKVNLMLLSMNLTLAPPS